MLNSKSVSITSRECLLILGTLLFTVSPLLVIVFYAAAALATFLQWREIRLDKEKAAIGLIILIISLWMCFRKVLPENYSPGTVAFTDYVPPFIFFYIMSLVPFSDSECRHFSYALLTTVPEQFIVGLLEQYYHWRGPRQLVINGVPAIDIFIGPYDPTLSLSATLYNPNILALYLVITFTVSLGLLLREVKSIKAQDKAVFWLWFRIFFAGLCLFLSLDLILLTRSRNAMAAVMLIALCYSIVYKKKMALLKAVASASIVFLLLTSFNLGLPSRLVRQHFLLSVTRFSESSHASLFRFRAEAYSCAEQLIRERPMDGWGLGMLTKECTRRMHNVVHAHDIFLQLAAEIGVPFTAVIACLFSYVFIVSLRCLARKPLDGKMRDIDLIFLITVGAVLLMQVFDIALLMTYRLNFLFWVCFAIVYSRVVREKQKA